MRFAVSITHLNGLAMPFEEAKILLERGRILRCARQRRAAVRNISRARALFAAIGAEPFIARCDRELGAELAGVDGPGHTTPLTARQLAVATAAATGKTNREIAADLFISVKTVEFHLSQILSRLAIDSRTEIASAIGSGRAVQVLPLGRVPT